MHVLGVARYVLARAISKRKNIANKERTADRLGCLLGMVTEVEPSDDELMLAAQFEESAQSFGVNLDIGESQLLAVLIWRSALLLVTGDKRAIRAMEPVVLACGYKGQVAQRVACLEQILMTLIRRHGAETFHARVCSEADVDIAMAICFKCASGSYTLESVMESLASYIRDLRRCAPNVLVDLDDLSHMISQEDGIG
jgi:hypothetical protein